jgi:hypothetical protein
MFLGWPIFSPKYYLKCPDSIFLPMSICLVLQILNTSRSQAVLYRHTHPSFVSPSFIGHMEKGR